MQGPMPEIAAAAYDDRREPGVCQVPPRLRNEAERAALAHECAQIVVEAERQLFLTRSRILQALPGMVRERAELLEIAERAAARGRMLTPLDSRGRRGGLRPVPPRPAASR